MPKRHAGCGGNGKATPLGPLGAPATQIIQPLSTPNLPEEGHLNELNTTDNAHPLPVAHTRGRAPLTDQNARRHGVFSKRLQPAELRFIDGLAEELRDLMGDSYSPRFEPAIIKLAGQLWRWQGVSAHLHRYGLGPASSALLRSRHTLERSISRDCARLGLDLESALSMRIRVDRYRGDDLDLDRLTAWERRELG